MQLVRNSAVAWRQTIAATAVLALVAWRGYVAIRGDEIRAAYNLGDDALKWFVVSFFEPFILLILLPAIPVFLASILVGLFSRRVNLLSSYRHGLIAAGFWTAIGLYAQARLT